MPVANRPMVSRKTRGSTLLCAGSASGADMFSLAVSQGGALTSGGRGLGLFDVAADKIAHPFHIRLSGGALEHGAPHAPRGPKEKTLVEHPARAKSGDRGVPGQPEKGEAVGRLP